jgi:4-aminobutyrate aminotransferase
LRAELASALARDPLVVDIRGLGLMIGVQFADADGAAGATATAVQKAAAERGLLLLTCGAWGDVVRFIPALVVDEEQISQAVELFVEAVTSVGTAQ